MKRSPAVASPLAAFNRRWGARREIFRRYAAPPWWAPGLVLDAAIRARYERYLPVGEYLRDLRALALDVLPVPAWLPRLLQPPRAGCCGSAGHADFSSLADLWAILPPALAGQVTLTDTNLLPLLCALADPPRFGADFGRYPEQLQAIAEFAGRRGRGNSDPGAAPLRILDLGCGTGQGTLEMAATVAGASDRSVLALGVTLEPLEAWMATARRLPHDPAREKRLAEYALPAAATCHFLAGNVTAVPVRGRFDLITANGLVGGRFLRSPQALSLFLSDVERLAASEGLVSFASHFHEGEMAGVALATDVARRRGWQVTSDARLLWLRKSQTCSR